MNNLEDIVQMALSAYDKSWDDKYSWSGVARIRDDFELELRRQIMQISSVKKEHTYTINPPNLMGTWATGGTQTHTRNCPPTITTTNKEILHG